MWQFWLIVSGICFVIEMITVGFLVFWFGIGALLAMISSFFIPNMYVQAFIFLISSTLLIFLTKPFVNKFVNKEKTIVTNAYSIIGKTGLVIQDIDPTLGTGQIKISGETWSAKSDSGEPISKDSKVEVIKIDGVKAVVKLTSNIPVHA